MPFFPQIAAAVVLHFPDRLCWTELTLSGACQSPQMLLLCPRGLRGVGPRQKHTDSCGTRLLLARGFVQTHADILRTVSLLVQNAQGPGHRWSVILPCPTRPESTPRCCWSDCRPRPSLSHLEYNTPSRQSLACLCVPRAGARSLVPLVSANSATTPVSTAATSGFCHMGLVSISRFLHTLSCFGLQLIPLPTAAPWSPINCSSSSSPISPAPVLPPQPCHKYGDLSGPSTAVVCWSATLTACLNSLSRSRSTGVR